MRDYAKISTTIWRSKKFRSVSDNDRLFYLYLHTCPHVNSVGCFVLPVGYMQADLGWSEEAIYKCIDSLSKAYLLEHNKQEDLVRIVDYLKFEKFTNQKHAAGAVKIATTLPDCHEKLKVLKDLDDHKYASGNEDLAKALDSLSKGSRTPDPDPDPDPDPERDSDSDEPQRAQSKANPKKRFAKPSLEDLVAEFNGRVTNPINEAQKFLNHYESNGWKVGKNPMKSWPHAVTNWITRSNDHAKHQPGGNKPLSRSEQSEAAFHAYIAELDSEDEESFSGGMGGLAEPPPGSFPGGQH